MSFVRQHSSLLAPARILRLALDKLVLPEFHSRRWGTLATILVFTLGFAQRMAASIIEVTTIEDKISGTGGCSLKEATYSSTFGNNVAVDSINSDGSDHFITTGCVAGTGDDTIVLPTGATLQLSTIPFDSHNPYGPTATPIITSNITIEANGATLEHSGTLNFRAFAVGNTGSLTIRNAHIKGFTVKGGDGTAGGGGGMGAGGAIYVQDGAVVIDSSSFDGNRAVGGNGSAIDSAAGGGGGGLSGNGGQPGLNSAYVDLVDGGGGGGSRGDGGTGADDGGGGGGTITMGFSPNGGFNCGGSGGTGSGDPFQDNDGHAGFCPGGGGGGGVSADPAIFGVSGNGGDGNYGGGGGGGGGGEFFSTGNGGDGGFGGGGGSSSYFPGGTAGSGGNGGFGGGGGGGQGGVIFGGPGQGGSFGGNADEPHGGGGAALGGAIFNDGGGVRILNSTFTGNSVYRGNSGGGSADNGADAGGAIFSLNGHLSVLNATISGNDSSGSGGGVVLIQTTPDASTFFALDNTIISNNGSDECAFAGFSITASGAGNLIQNNDNCLGVVATADPQLGPLQDNGGFTPTMAISTASSAWNTADSGTSLGVDQRGQVRPAMNGLFDIGAFELCEKIERLIITPCPPIEFGVAETEPLTMQVSPAAAGNTTPPAGLNNEPLGSVTALTATPNPGYQFVDWTGNVADPTNASTTVIMDNPQTVTANFVACGCAADVSNSVTVTRLGFVLNLGTGRYSQTVTVTNNSPNTITGPISLVLDSLSSDAALFNATGTTDSLESPAGSPYLNVNVNLAAGQKTSFTLQFTDPTHAAITYTTRVLVGPGAR